jgi:hypothetical protein
MIDFDINILGKPMFQRLMWRIKAKEHRYPTVLTCLHAPLITCSLFHFLVFCWFAPRLVAEPTHSTKSLPCQNKTLVEDKPWCSPMQIFQACSRHILQPRLRTISLFLLNFSFLSSWGEPIPPFYLTKLTTWHLLDSLPIFKHRKPWSLNINKMVAR